jgi:hypothetical protein
MGANPVGGVAIRDTTLRPELPALDRRGSLGATIHD